MIGKVSVMCVCILSSNLEVVDEPDLLLAAIWTEADTTAAEHEVGKLDQVSVFLDEKLDAISVRVEWRDQKLLEDDELINILQRIAEPFEEFVGRDATQSLITPIKDPVRLTVENVRCKTTIVVKKELL